MPILTSEDEIDLSRLEGELVKALIKHAKEQKKVVKMQLKLADQLADDNIERAALNRVMRDVLKQIQMLAREKKSNVHEEDVNILEKLIHQNDEYTDATKEYLNKIKDLAVRKEYLVNKKAEYADALSIVATKRKEVIKKALDVEKAKNKMIDGDKLNEMDQIMNDIQREFDRARDILLKKIEQFLEVRNEINKLWLDLKNATTELS